MQTRAVGAMEVFCGTEFERYDTAYFYSTEVNTILQELCVDSASVMQLRTMIVLNIKLYETSNVIGFFP
jgi:hypothetical protein